MKHDAQQLLTIADAQADAVARWKVSKRVQRTAQHRRRMEQVSEANDRAFLQAVDRDDRTDPAERELANFARVEQVPA